MRGFTRSIRSTMAATTSVQANREAATAGISAISRAIALAACGSVIAAGTLVDGLAQISPFAPEQLCGFAEAEPQSEQDGSFDIAVGLIEIARGGAFRTADDLAHHQFGPA